MPHRPKQKRARLKALEAQLDSLKYDLERANRPPIAPVDPNTYFAKRSPYKLFGSGSRAGGGSGSGGLGGGAGSGLGAGSFSSAYGNTARVSPRNTTGVGTGMAGGGRVMNRRGYQVGGLASLEPPITPEGGLPMGGLPMAPPMGAPPMGAPPMGAPPMGPPPMAPPMATPMGPPPMGAPPVGLPPGGPPGMASPETVPTDLPPSENLSDEQLVEIYIGARMALLGEHPDAQAAIQIFLQYFGEEELRLLAEAVAAEQGVEEDAGLIEGPGTGTSDSIPAVIDGQEPVNLSDGEFVMTEDAVRGAGGGSPQMGAENLYSLMDELQQVGQQAGPPPPPRLPM